MLHKDLLHYVDRQMRDACNNDLPFGGKVVIISGDWKQLCPIVLNSTRLDEVKASIKKSPMFGHFEQLKYVLFGFKYIYII